MKIQAGTISRACFEFLGPVLPLSHELVIHFLLRRVYTSGSEVFQISFFTLLKLYRLRLFFLAKIPHNCRKYSLVRKRTSNPVGVSFLQRLLLGRVPCSSTCYDSPVMTDICLPLSPPLSRASSPNLKQRIQAILHGCEGVQSDAPAVFETAFAHACHSLYGVGMRAQTDAIALGLRACGLGPGDEILVPANVAMTTMMGVLQTGATPILVDCEPETALIDLTATEKAIGPHTRAILATHQFGQMVSPSRLLQLASTYDLLIFEEATQAPLAEREGYRAGSVGVAAVFSFYPGQNLASLGDGCLLVTRDRRIAETVRLLRDYQSLSPQSILSPTHKEGRGLLPLQAALLSAKLPSLPSWNRDRYRIAQRYDQLLHPLATWGIVPLRNDSESSHVYHHYVIRVTERCPIQRMALQLGLEAQGIVTRVHYPLPCHLQPAFQSLGYRLGDFPQAERLCKEVLFLPMHPGLEEHQIRRTVGAIANLISSQVQ